LLKIAGAEVEQPHGGTRFLPVSSLGGLPVHSNLGARLRMVFG